MSSEEIFPLVNEEGTVIGQASRRECHSGSFLLHPVVHLHLFNSRGELFLQKRSMRKDIQPGKWDTAVGGHFSLGETAEQALRRESFEELGIQGFEPEFLTKYVFQSRVERELVYVFRTCYDGEITPDGDELEGGRFWTLAEIEESLSTDVFTPNFEQEYERLNTLGIFKSY